MEGEIPKPNETIRGSSQRKGKTSLCPVCPARFTNVRRHVLCSHLPWYIAPNSACWTCKIQFAQEKLFQVHNINFHDNKEDPHKFSADEHGDTWVKLMNGLLLKIANQLGITTLSYIIKDPDFINCRGSIHHWTDILLIKMFNEKNRYPSIDISHTVYPSEHIHSALHWKILSLLIQKTESAENLISYEVQNNVWKEEGGRCQTTVTDNKLLLPPQLAN
jgi:hypothetical protein